eukprot:213364_1
MDGFIKGHNRNIPISSRIHNPFSSNIAPNNNNTIPEDIYASPSHKTCIKPSDTLPIFDANERWTNANVFTPGYEEIIDALQTMFPCEIQIVYIQFIIFIHQVHHIKIKTNTIKYTTSK